MAARHLVTATLLLLGVATSVAGQGRESSAQGAAADPGPGQVTTVDVSRLPVDLERIQRQLRFATVREERDGLNLRYIVDVYGQAPRIQLFTRQDNLLYGPAPYGAPTHREMIQHVTPQEYRAPAADVSALFRWLADKTKNKEAR